MTLTALKTRCPRCGSEPDDAPTVTVEKDGRRTSYALHYPTPGEQTNLFAHTEAGGSLPGYISINKRDGRFFVAVRSRGQDYAQEIEVTPELLESLACTLMDTLDPEQASPQWRPIETAPTDRIHSPPLRALVLSVLDDGTPYVEEAWLDNERHEWWPANVDHTDAHGAPIYPTHWMPLPTPSAA